MAQYSSYNRMNNKKARNDFMLESQIGEFVFNKLWNAPEFKDLSPERITDKELQIKGVDVKIGDWMIDEKCKYYDSKTKGFMTELLQYPSFEVSMVNQSGNIQIGWFLNPNNITTHYAFIQPFVKNNVTPTNFTMNGLSHVVILLVNKNDLNQIKNEQDLYSDSIRLRESFNMSNERRMRYHGKNYWLTYSPTFNERPVNLVIPRDMLKSLPHSREFILK